MNLDSPILRIPVSLQVSYSPDRGHRRRVLLSDPSGRIQAEVCFGTPAFIHFDHILRKNFEHYDDTFTTLEPVNEWHNLGLMDLSEGDLVLFSVTRPLVTPSTHMKWEAIA